MAAQGPHQLLNVPFTLATVKAGALVMSTLKVTLNAIAMMELRAISIVVIRYFFIDFCFGFYR
jgi:hypothetical protein